MPQRVLVRRAAVQPTDTGQTGALTQKGAVEQRVDARFIAHYNDWQGPARRYARTISAAAFAPSVIADLIARCDVRVEQRIEGEWKPSELPAFDGLFELYRNPLQGPDELVRLHAEHYNIAGEMLQTQLDNTRMGTVDYGIYSTVVAEWDKPEPGLVTIKLVPDGKVDKETAFVVPRRQVVRFWLPDREYPAYATSSMATSIDDLRRYDTLRRAAMATAASHLATAGGIVWAPAQANESLSTPDDHERDEGDPAAPQTSIEDAYYAVAQRRIDPYDDDVTGVAPAFWTWDKELGAPEYVDFDLSLDEAGIAHRREALEDFARSGPLPASTLVGGGVGDANHWSEWLATEKVFASGVAPTADRIFHLDLTWSFLWPRARLAGYTEAQLLDLRLGYDPAPVLVHPDNSQSSREAIKLGAINFAAVREAGGWSEDDAMIDPDEREWLLAVLSAGNAGNALAGTDPSLIDAASTTEAPPAPGESSPGATAPPTLQRVASVLEAALSRNGHGS